MIKFLKLKYNLNQLTKQWEGKLSERDGSNGGYTTATMVVQLVTSGVGGRKEER